MTPVDAKKMRKVVKGMKFFSLEVANGETGLGFVTEREKEILAMWLFQGFEQIGRNIGILWRGPNMKKHEIVVGDTVRIIDDVKVLGESNISAMVAGKLGVVVEIALGDHRYKDPMNYRIMYVSQDGISLGLSFWMRPSMFEVIHGEKGNAD